MPAVPAQRRSDSATQRSSLNRKGDAHLGTKSCSEPNSTHTAASALSEPYKPLPRAHPNGTFVLLRDPFGEPAESPAMSAHTAGESVCQHSFHDCEVREWCEPLVFEPLKQVIRNTRTGVCKTDLDSAWAPSMLH